MKGANREDGGLFCGLCSLTYSIISVSVMYDYEQMPHNLFRVKYGSGQSTKGAGSGGNINETDKEASGVGATRNGSTAKNQEKRKEGGGRNIAGELQQ